MDVLAHIRSRFPASGLFGGKVWRLSPEVFGLEGRLLERLEGLGPRLAVFQRACNRLYYLSVKGRQPGWVAEYVDAGKPPEVVALGRERALREELPKVIRPDLLLTEGDGLALTEIDTVPGGIGLTGWLGRVYGEVGAEVTGGPSGMLDGFESLMPEGGAVLMSEEAGDYRPEMEWLTGELNGRAAGRGRAERWAVTAVEGVAAEGLPGRCYRFFEMFDLPNIPGIWEILGAAGTGKISLTAPPKAFLEEKLWLALFWSGPLREFWRRELGDRYWRDLQEIIPFSWVVDPAPVPHHATLPRLEARKWEELGGLSQKERNFVLKISGFSPLGWGSRGVHIAADMPQGEWREALGRAVESFPRNPYVLQEFRKGRTVRQRWAALGGTGEGTEVMEGRVRLCPYYFHDGSCRDVRLGGVLATVVPADKKLVHGMSEAVLAPCGRR